MLDDMRARLLAVAAELQDRALSAAQPRQEILVEDAELQGWYECPTCGEVVLMGEDVAEQGDGWGN